MRKGFLFVSFSLVFALTVVFSFTSVKASEIEPYKGVSGTVIINNQTYKYQEVSWGKNRGIQFNPGNHVYKISPNPHNNPAYNKNQIKFYNQIAEGVKKEVEKSGWKNTFTNVKALKESYTLNKE